MEKAIVINNLKKSYNGTVALRGISLSINKGEFYGLLGPNGAGKTTTIGIITGLVKIDSGEVQVGGKDIVRDFRYARARIGVSPQDLTMDWFFPIEKLLIFQAGYYGIPQRVIQPRIEHLLKEFGLWEKRSAKIRQLSGGMKKRFSIIKALVHDPQILILDEPTAGVDVELRHKLWDYLKELHKQGKTILLTTHYIEEAESLCRRVAIIDEGNIVVEGTPSDLIRSLGKENIVVQLSGWTQEKEIHLKPYVFSSEMQDAVTKLIFTVDNPEKELTNIISLLGNQGCHIHTINISKSTLEEVFIALTGKGIND